MSSGCPRVPILDAGEKQTTRSLKNTGKWFQKYTKFKNEDFLPTQFVHNLQIYTKQHLRKHPPKTNVTLEKQAWMKMYLLLNIRWFSSQFVFCKVSK